MLSPMSYLWIFEWQYLYYNLLPYCVFRDSDLTKPTGSAHASFAPTAAYLWICYTQYACGWNTLIVTCWWEHCFRRHSKRDQHYICYIWWGQKSLMIELYCTGYFSKTTIKYTDTFGKYGHKHTKNAINVMVKYSFLSSIVWQVLFLVGADFSRKNPVCWLLGCFHKKRHTW